MKENNEIDNIFKSGLENLEVKPSNERWNALQSDLTKKREGKKRKKRFWIFSLALLITFVGVTTYRFVAKKQTSQTINTEKSLSDNSSSPENVLHDNKLKEAGSTVASTNNNIILNEQNITTEQNSNDNVSNVNSEVTTESRSDNISKNKIYSNPVSTENKSEKLKSSSYVTEELIYSEDKKVKTESSKIKVSPNNPLKSSEIKSDRTDVSKESTKLKAFGNLPVSANSNSPKTENNSPVAIELQKDNLVIENEGEIVEESNVEPSDQLQSGNEQNAEKGIVNDNTSRESVLPDNNIQNNSAIENIVAENNSAIKNENEAIVSSASSDIKSEETNQAIVADSSKTKSEVIDYAPAVKPDSSRPFLKRLISHLSVEAFYSPDYVVSRLKVNSEYLGSASQSIDDYDNNKSEFSYSTGLNIRYDVGKKWSIAAGISYSTFSQSAIYNTINVIIDSVYQEVHGHNSPGSSGPGGGGHGGGGHGGGGHGGGHHGGGHGGGGHGGGHHGNHNHHPPGGNGQHYVIQTPCGAVDLLNQPPNHNSGNAQNGDTLSTKAETYETIHFINIPLTVRYSFGQKKLSYFVEGGASLNMVRSDEVKLTINDSYTEMNEHDGLKTTSYSLLFSVGGKYNIYKGLSMFLKPSLRYTITPINQNNPMNSYPYYLGIGAGISIHF
jgi:hypothetical protein